MRFMWRVVFRAKQRQTRIDTSGRNWVLCARCGKKLFPVGQGHAVPITSKELGGRATIENCAILCDDCYLEIGQDTAKLIPYAELPFFDG